MQRCNFGALLATATACGQTPASTVDAGLTWGEPVLVMPLPGDDPTLTADLLELYFDHESDEIYVMTRPDTTSAWSAAVPVAELQAAGSVSSTPEISPDGLTLLFSSTREGSQDLDVWMTTRSSRATAWSAPVRIVEVASSEDDFSASRSADGRVLVLARPSNGRDLYITKRADDQVAWPPPVPLDELDTSADESEAHLGSDGLTITFSSDRAGSQDLYVARRAQVDAPFEPAQLVPVSTNANETDPWMSPDGRMLYFMRGDALWMAHLEAQDER